MSDTIIVQPVVNELTVTEEVNDVIVSSVGVQGPAGAAGATGATGPQGPSGVVTVNAPLTNAGTSSAANLSISAGTTSTSGVLQLTDSVSSTSTTTAATPNAVKTIYDLAIKSIPAFSYVTGRFYRSPAVNVLTSTFAPVVDRTYYMPFYVRQNNTFDRIGFVSGSTFSGTGVVRLGIYNDTDGFPSTVVLDAGTVSVTALNTTYTITISKTLPVGWYWLAFNSQTVGSVNSFYGTNLAGYFIADLGMTAMINNATQGYTQNVNVSSGFATAGSLTSVLQNPVVNLRST